MILIFDPSFPGFVCRLGCITEHPDPRCCRGFFAIAWVPDSQKFPSIICLCHGLPQFDQLIVRTEYKRKYKHKLFWFGRPDGVDEQAKGDRDACAAGEVVEYQGEKAGNVRAKTSFLVVYATTHN